MDNNFDQFDVDAAKALLDYINKMGHDNNAFVETIARDHRTLQQGFTALCFEWIRRCAKKEKEQDFDLRNEYSVQKCAEIVNNVEIYEPPFI